MTASPPRTYFLRTLGLEHRHYNASLLSFDDLVGFPVPQEGRVVYLQTPATVWEAESVLVDEVSRCRPRVQNKPFPLVHERVLAAMRRALDDSATAGPRPGGVRRSGPVPALVPLPELSSSSRRRSA